MMTQKDFWLHIVILEEQRAERLADPPSPGRDAWIQQCDEYLRELRTKISPEEIEQFSDEYKRSREHSFFANLSNPACKKEYWDAALRRS